MTYIHFHKAESPNLVLLAVETSSREYTCQFPYVEGTEIRTFEYVITKTVMASRIQAGTWIIDRINNIPATELNDV